MSRDKDLCSQNVKDRRGTQVMLFLNRCFIDLVFAGGIPLPIGREEGKGEEKGGQGFHQLERITVIILLFIFSYICTTYLS